jgi:hypothetical protein
VGFINNETDDPSLKNSRGRLEQGTKAAISCDVTRCQEVDVATTSIHTFDPWILLRKRLSLWVVCTDSLEPWAEVSNCTVEISNVIQDQLCQRRDNK